MKDHDIEAFFKNRIKIRNLKILYLLGKYNSITKSAEELNITPSAVSKTLIETEKSYGRELFIRKSKKLYPSPEAMILINLYQDILNKFYAYKSSIYKIRGFNTESISLGMFSPSMENSLAKATIRFKEKYHYTNVNIINSPLETLLKMVKNNEINFCIARLHLSEIEESLSGIILHEEKFVIVASTKLEIKKNSDIYSLIHYAWCIPNSLRNIFNEAFQKHGIEQPLNQISFSDYIFGAKFIESYPCLSIVSENLAKDLERRSIVKIIKCDLYITSKPQVIVWNANKFLMPIEKDFRDYICLETAFSLH